MVVAFICKWKKMLTYILNDVEASSFFHNFFKWHLWQLGFILDFIFKLCVVHCCQKNVFFLIKILTIALLWILSLFCKLQVYITPSNVFSHLCCLLQRVYARIVRLSLTLSTCRTSSHWKNLIHFVPASGYLNQNTN